MDENNLITKVVPTIEKQKLLCLDPLYYVKRQSLYADFYTHKDHLAIAALMDNLDETNWIVSYDDDMPEIRKYFAGFKPIEYALQYNANARYMGNEVLFCCEALGVSEIV